MFAAQSVIIDSDGYACMGDDKSRKQTESAAVQEARRNAGEAAVAYISTETKVSAVGGDILLNNCCLN